MVPPPYLKTAADAAFKEANDRKAIEERASEERADVNDGNGIDNSALEKASNSIDSEIEKLHSSSDTLEAWQAVNEHIINRLKIEVSEERVKNKRKSALGAIDAKVFLDPGEAILSNIPIIPK